MTNTMTQPNTQTSIASDDIRPFGIQAPEADLTDRAVVEQLKIIDPLTDPTAHGGKASDAFDVVVPNMPGYGFQSYRSRYDEIS